MCIRDSLNGMSLFCTDDLTNLLAFIEAVDSTDTADTTEFLSCRENTEADTGETHYGDCSPFEFTALHASVDSLETAGRFNLLIKNKEDVPGAVSSTGLSVIQLKRSEKMGPNIVLKTQIK